MGAVLLYVPESVPRGFLKFAERENIVRIVPHLSEPYAVFGRIDSCACSTRNSLAIQDRSIILMRNHHSTVSFPLYKLPEDCKFDETFIIVTWLLRYRFKTFHSSLNKEGIFLRFLTSASIVFRLKTFSTCCDQYTLKDDPVFMLSSILFSPYGRGPVIENVIQTKLDG